MRVTFRAVIVDDEHVASQSLTHMLVSHGTVQVCAVATTIEEGIEVINRTRPDIVLLDMRLNGRSGFEIINKVSHQEFDLIIISAFEAYALDGYKHNACAYLLKPVSPKELEKAILQIHERHAKLCLPGSKRGHTKRILLHSQEGVYFFSLDQVIYCQADGRYTTFYLKNAKPFVVSKNIGEYEKVLTQHHGFFRVHHSFIINLNEVVSYLRDGCHVVMSDGSKVNVARGRKELFFQTIGQR
jgi:two-component system, LytTR family, response regulator